MDSSVETGPKKVSGELRQPEGLSDQEDILSRGYSWLPNRLAVRMPRFLTQEIDTAQLLERWPGASNEILAANFCEE